MKAALILLLACCATVTALAQTKKEESACPTIRDSGSHRKQACVSSAYSWYQSGKVRVFFSTDFARALNSIGDGPDYNDEFQETLGRLFRSGSLTGDMFYGKIGDIPPGVSNVSRADTERLLQTDVFHAMESYSGPLIKILWYEIVSRSETHFETVEYELWVTSSRQETGWGEFHKFRITTKKRLLLGPKLVKFEYLGMQI